MAEWLKAADCKSVLIEYGGSNPPLPTKKSRVKHGFFFVESEVRFEKERESDEPKVKNDEQEIVQWTIS